MLALAIGPVAYSQEAQPVPSSTPAPIVAPFIPVARVNAKAKAEINDDVVLNLMGTESIGDPDVKIDPKSPRLADGSPAASLEFSYDKSGKLQKVRAVGSVAGTYRFVVVAYGRPEGSDRPPIDVATADFVLFDPDGPPAPSDDDTVKPKPPTPPVPPTPSPIIGAGFIATLIVDSGVPPLELESLAPLSESQTIGPAVSSLGGRWYKVDTQSAEYARRKLGPALAKDDPAGIGSAIKPPALIIQDAAGKVIRKAVVSLPADESAVVAYLKSLTGAN